MTTALDAPEEELVDAPRPRRRRFAAALVGAIDGALLVALPFAVCAVLAVLAWAGIGRPDAWGPYLGAAADLWLLGHGVDVRFAAALPFTVTATVLGPMLVTAAGAVVSGRRAAATDAPALAWGATVVAAALAAVVVLRIGTSAVAAPVAWQGVLMPVGVVAVAALAGLRARRPGTRPMPPAVRAGLAATVLLLGAAAAVLAVLLLVRFADVVSLYESLSAGPVGGLVLTVGQVLALPTFVVWTAAWLLGPGVTLGIGSTTGPFAAQVGPLPALPVLGAVPAQPPAWAAAVLVIPVLAGFVAAVLARRTGAATPAVPFGLVAGIVAGLSTGLLAALAAGSAGPGRFGAVGPDALLVATAAAVLIGVPAMIGAAVVRPRIRPAEPEDPGR